MVAKVQGELQSKAVSAGRAETGFRAITVPE